MTSTIKVDNIQDQDGNNIINENANTITIGASGDTVTLASGASQTGFGRTGTVDWQTTPKTATFTAVSGEGYFCNTTSGAFEVDLPVGTAGAIVSIQDYNNTFDTNNLTIDPNGSEKINGGAAGLPLTLSTEGQGLTLVYVDGTVGWRSVHSDDFSQVPETPAFITATGGTVTTVCTNFKVHTFTGPGTFQVTCAGNSSGSNTLEYLVVAGGGAGGPASPSNGGGGGGAGGYRESSGTAGGSYTVSPLGGCVSGLTASAASFPITVGAGGSATPSSGNAQNSGSNSVFSTITSAGGGAGGIGQPNSAFAGKPGGSGGGGGGYATAGNPAGTGNTPPVSPPQGKDGGIGSSPTHPGNFRGGGGGGALAVGTSGGPGGGDGGGGATSSINATPTARAGGGGAGCTSTPASFDKGAGGAGGGGAGAGNSCAVAGTTNTGGGGGGGGYPSPFGAGAAGGSGIVIIRYKFQ